MLCNRKIAFRLQFQGKKKKNIFHFPYLRRIKLLTLGAAAGISLFQLKCLKVNALPPKAMQVFLNLPPGILFFDQIISRFYMSLHRCFIIYDVRPLYIHWGDCGGFLYLPFMFSLSYLSWSTLFQYYRVLLPVPQSSPNIF